MHLSKITCFDPDFALKVIPAVTVFDLLAFPRLEVNSLFPLEVASFPCKCAFHRAPAFHVQVLFKPWRRTPGKTCHHTPEHLEHEMAPGICSLMQAAA